jgi:hypothetical protein
LDARIEHITREHGDVEFWVERVNANPVKGRAGRDRRYRTGYNRRRTHCEVTWGAEFSTAYFD